MWNLLRRCRRPRERRRRGRG